MSDYISRQAAIEAHCELCGDRDTCNCDICPDVEVFQLLPSAQPELITVNIDHELTQEEYEKLRKDMANAPIMLLPSAQQWIPCSERLPEESGDYLVTVAHHSGELWVEVDQFDNANGSWWLYMDEVTAWMPLPEPYKGEES